VDCPRIDPGCRLLFESLPIKMKDEILESSEDIGTKEKLNAAVMRRLYELQPEQCDEVMKIIRMSAKS